MGFSGSDPGCRHGTAWQKAMLWSASHGYSRGRWAWMLAEGQSSSAKSGGLAADVSSGLIFLKKRKKRGAGGHVVLYVTHQENKRVFGLVLRASGGR